MEGEIIAVIDKKDADPTLLADRIIREPSLIPRFLEGIGDQRARVKYGSEKALRAVSERRPDLLYPYFDDFERLLDAENSFIKWGAIRTIANLAAADTNEKIEAIFKKYFAPVTGPVMVAAANIIGGAVSIARAKPALTDRIVKEIMKVEKAAYEKHGAPSPECRNVLCGQAIDALDELYGLTGRKKTVREFVRRQLQSTRPAVRKRAAAFLKAHAAP